MNSAYTLHCGSARGFSERMRRKQIRE